MYKLNLGCGPLPLHPQHLQVMQNPDEWTLIDKFVKDPQIKNWDAEKLDEVPNASVTTIYASHLLEHISHRILVPVLETWYKKLTKGGQLIINVPDIEWAAKQIMKFENGQLLTGVYSDFEGDRGLQSIIYGTHDHEGEYHKAAFTRTSLMELLDGVGYEDINIDKIYDAHDMGVLISSCYK